MAQLSALHPSHVPGNTHQASVFGVSIHPSHITNHKGAQTYLLRTSWCTFSKSYLDNNPQYMYCDSKYIMIREQFASHNPVALFLCRYNT